MYLCAAPRGLDPVIVVQDVVQVCLSDVVTFKKNNANLSPSSDRLLCPRNHLPLLALGVISTTKSLPKKYIYIYIPLVYWDGYERANVETYIIIHRDLPLRNDPRLLWVVCLERERGEQAVILEDGVPWGRACKLSMF